MFLKRQNGVKIPSPSVIAVTGKVAKKRFILEGFSKKSIFTVGSTRHNINNLKNNPIKQKPDPKLYLLFICGLGYEMVICKITC